MGTYPEVFKEFLYPLADSKNMRDNSPVNDTCPAIDTVIGIMEDLREANAALRAWGNEQYNMVQDLESKVEDLEDKIKDLEGEIDELESENRE